VYTPHPWYEQENGQVCSSLVTTTTFPRMLEEEGEEEEAKNTSLAQLMNCSLKSSVSNKIWTVPSFNLTVSLASFISLGRNNNEREKGQRTFSQTKYQRPRSFETRTLIRGST